MRILFTIPTLNPKDGGVVEVVRLYSKYLSKLNHKVEILTLDQYKLINISGVKIHCLGRPYFNSFNLRLIIWLFKFIKSYDVVIINSSWQLMNFFCGLISKKNTIPYYYFPHGMLDNYFHKNIFKYLKKYFYWLILEKYLVNNSEQTIFMSKEEINSSIYSFPGFKAKKSHILFGIESSNLKTKIFNKKKIPKKLLFLSRVDPKKGCENLFRAFNKINYKNINFILIIAGPYKEEYKKKLFSIIDKNKHKFIQWVGMVRGSLKKKLLYEADGFILPSHQENFGIAVIEALNYGVPVFISNKINIHSFIKNNKAGFIDNDSVEGTLNLLNKFNQCSHQELKVLSNNAIECYNNNFKIEKAVQILEKKIKRHDS